MDAKITPASKELCKEWKSLTGKTCSHINQQLWLKGWLIIGFGIIIIGFVAHAWHERGDRFERNFDGRQQGMMQWRAGMMWWFFWDENKQNVQWCTQQASIQIDPQNPDAQIVTARANCPFANKGIDQENANSFFGRMENRMKQFFGKDSKWVAATWTITTGTAK